MGKDTKDFAGTELSAGGENSEQFEARMIAQFNEKVNAVENTESDQPSNKGQLEDGKKTAIVKEHNGPKGLEPTRYGDWEAKGRCHDF